ncbi:unnamed protein product [Ectocarpus sp. 13 AM-2016]
MDFVAPVKVDKWLRKIQSTASCCKIQTEKSAGGYIHHAQRGTNPGSRLRDGEQKQRTPGPMPTFFFGA